MASELGLDPYEMRRAASALDAQANDIRRNSSAVTNEVNRAWWQGPDAERFKQEWLGVHHQSAARIASALYTLANRIRYEAARQEEASHE